MKIALCKIDNLQYTAKECENIPADTECITLPVSLKSSFHPNVDL